MGGACDKRETRRPTAVVEGNRVATVFFPLASLTIQSTLHAGETRRERREADGVPRHHRGALHRHIGVHGVGLDRAARLDILTRRSLGGGYRRPRKEKLDATGYV